MNSDEYTLDITNDVCPITYVKTKLRLEDMSEGQVLIIRLRDGEALDNVPRTLRDNGHEILECSREVGDVFVIRVRKGPDLL